jgi:hypothetical protein
MKPCLLALRPRHLFPVFACCLTLYAADQWMNKDYKQWTSSEVHQVLSDSPWARQVQISFRGMDARQRTNFPSDSGGPMGENGPGAIGGGGIGGGGMAGGGMGGMGRGGMGGGMGRQGTGQGRSRESEPPVYLTVRWASGLPVRDALQQPEKDYVLTIAGLFSTNQFAGQRQPGIGGTSQTDDGDGSQVWNMAEQMRRQLMSSARLVRKGKDPITASDVKQINGPNGEQEFEVFFPKSDPIALKDKDVEFQAQVRTSPIQKKFRLKDMVYKGNLEL